MPGTPARKPGRRSSQHPPFMAGTLAGPPTNPQTCLPFLPCRSSAAVTSLPTGSHTQNVPPCACIVHTNSSFRQSTNILSLTPRARSGPYGQASQPLPHWQPFMCVSMWPLPAPLRPRGGAHSEWLNNRVKKKPTHALIYKPSRERSRLCVPRTAFEGHKASFQKL